MTNTKQQVGLPEHLLALFYHDYLGNILHVIGKESDTFIAYFDVIFRKFFSHNRNCYLSELVGISLVQSKQRFLTPKVVKQIAFFLREFDIQESLCHTRDQLMPSS